MKCSPPARLSCYRSIGVVFFAAMAAGLPLAAAQSPAEWNTQYRGTREQPAESGSLSASGAYHVSAGGADPGRGS